jgi:cytochrome P450
MAVVEADRPSRLAGPAAPDRPLGFFKFVRVTQDNFIAGFHEGAYRRGILERKFLWFRSFIINEPDGIKRVLLDNAANYVKADILRPTLGPALGSGLVTSEGDKWRALRKLIAPVFDQQSIESYVPIISESVQAMLRPWEGLPVGSPIDIYKAMTELTLDIISRAMFSSDSADMVDLIDRSSLEYQTKMTFSFWGVVPVIRQLWARYKQREGERIVRAMDEAIYRLIARRSQEFERRGQRDLLDRLIAARDGDTGFGLSSREVRDQVVTIMLAGHETSATALTWICYLLSQHPPEEAKLHRELDHVLGARAPTYDDVPRLKYTRMIIQEAMRLYPPFHTLSWRQAVEVDEVCGRRIPKGAIVLIVPWLLHRSPDLWERPERFEPERFSDDRNATRSRYGYLPFSIGPRICIGAAFAMTEVVLILASIAQRCRLRLMDGHPVEPQGLVTLRPRHGLRMLVERRRAVGSAVDHQARATGERAGQQ